MFFDFIVCTDVKGGIAKNKTMPWSNSDEGKTDMNWFKKKTINSAVIMGKNTWDSIPAQYKPLSSRVNIVVSNSLQKNNNIIISHSFEDALEWCAKNKMPRVFVIGGASIYAIAFNNFFLRKGYHTVINENYNCDLFVEVPHGVRKTIYRKNNLCIYKINYKSREQNYILLLSKLINSPRRENRTRECTRGVFHETLKFKLTRNGKLILPLLTTKKLSWHNIYTEAIWFLSGECTNTTFLKNNNVNIWDQNSSREFLDKVNLQNYKVGELGPIYGFQWRKWNAKYASDSCEPAIDQLENVINTLKTNPWDRRMLVSAWNPAALHLMALPPCHFAFQFHVDPDEFGKPLFLNCIVYMRSADVFLGVPWNIACYSFITHIIAKICNLIPKNLSISMTDCHIYENSINKCKQQIKRRCLLFPTFKFAEKINNLTLHDVINKYSFNDYIIEGYNPHPALWCKMIA